MRKTHIFIFILAMHFLRTKSSNKQSSITKKCLSIAEQSEGDMNLELDSIHFSLGTAFLENGELEQAIEHYEKCLSIELQAEENEEEPDSGVAYIQESGA